MDQLVGGQGLVRFINSLHLLSQYRFMSSSLPSTILTSHLQLSLRPQGSRAQLLPGSQKTVCRPRPLSTTRVQYPNVPNTLAYEIQVTQFAQSLPFHIGFSDSPLPPILPKMNNTSILSQLRSLVQTKALDLRNLYVDHFASPAPLPVPIW